MIYKDYGFNIDEKFHRSSGIFWLIYVADFFGLDQFKTVAESKFNDIKGFTLSPVEHFNKYGVIFDLPAAFIEIILKLDQPINYYYLRHFLIFIYYFIGAIFFYKLLRNRFKSEFLAIIGLLLLILTPRLFGDSFQNNKDIVFLSLYSISLFYYFKTLDSNNFSNILFFSLFSALATSIRIVGFFLPISFLFFWLINYFSQRKDLNIKIIFLNLFSYLFFFIIFWPLLWENPIQNFFKLF